MYAEILAAISSAKALLDVLKAAHTLSNANELHAAVYEVYTKLMAATGAALEAQEKQAALAQRVCDLEQELVQLKDWDREAERYQLTALAADVMVYALKPGMEQGEPPHYLCTQCFAEKKKLILQRISTPQESPVYRCPQCKNELYVFAVRKTRRTVTPKHWLAQ